MIIHDTIANSSFALCAVYIAHDLLSIYVCGYKARGRALYNRIRIYSQRTCVCHRRCALPLRFN